MSDCGCKGGSVNKEAQEQIDKAAFGSSIILRLVIFLFSLVIIAALLIPVILPFMIILLFNRIVLQKGTNLNGMFLSIGKALKTSKKRDEDEYDEGDDISGEDINPENYELMDVEVIK